MRIEPETFSPFEIDGIESAAPNFDLSRTLATFAKMTEGILHRSAPQSEQKLTDNLDSPTTGTSQNIGCQLEPEQYFKPKEIEQTRYKLLKKLEGTVLRLEGTGFVARLVENATDFPAIEANIDLEELPESERPFAIEGASLVLTVGYRYQGGTRKRESEIYFRRLPPWTDDEAQKALASAHKLVNAINWD
jgi:hypothetical protein